MSQSLPSLIFAVSARVRASSIQAARAKLACHLRRLVRIPYLSPGEVIYDDFLVQDSTVALTRSWYQLPDSKSFVRMAPDLPSDRHVTLNLRVNVSRQTRSETMEALKNEVDLLADDIEHKDLLGQQGGRDTADIFWEISDPTGLASEGQPEDEAIDPVPQAALEEAFQRHLGKQQRMVEELGLAEIPQDFQLFPLNRNIAGPPMKETAIKNGSAGLGGETARLLFGMAVRVSGSSPDKLQAQFARNCRLISTAMTGGLYSGEWVGTESDEIEHARAVWETHTMPDPDRVPDYVPTLPAPQQTKFEHTAVMTLTMEDRDVTPSVGIAHIAAELLRLSKELACTMTTNGFTGPGVHVKVYGYSIRH